MVLAPRKPCRTCQRATANRNGYCDAHQGDVRSRQRELDRARQDTATRRLYRGARWARLRAWQLTREPLCAYCMKLGRVTLAGVVDHRQPHKGSEALFFDPTNLQSLCAPCHNREKQREEIAASKAGSS